MGPQTPGSGVVVVRVEHACRLRRVKVQIVTAEAPARPGSTPCWLAGLDFSRAFSMRGKLLQLCPALRPYGP